MYIRMIYHMPKAIGWHGDSRKLKFLRFWKIVKNPFLDRNFNIHEIKDLKKYKARNVRILFWNLKFCRGQI